MPRINLRSVCQLLSDDTPDRPFGTLNVIDTEGNAVAVAEVKYSGTCALSNTVPTVTRNCRLYGPQRHRPSLTPFTSVIRAVP